MNHTQADSTSVVTLGRTTTTTAMIFPQQVVGDNLKLCEPECVVKLPMPLICKWQYWCSKWRHSTRCSSMKDVDDTTSNSALVTVVEPSEAITWTWHLVNNTRQQWSVDCDTWDVTLAGAFFNEDGDAFVCLWGLTSLMRWSQVWWGLWHFWHLWMEGHCFTMWSGLR